MGRKISLSELTAEYSYEGRKEIRFDHTSGRASRTAYEQGHHEKMRLAYNCISGN